MFAELCTEAGPIEMPRAEAVATDTPDVYLFQWRNVPATIEENIKMYARIYISRVGGACFGMVPISKHALIPEGMGLDMRWSIVIPFKGRIEE